MLHKSAVAIPICRRVERHGDIYGIHQTRTAGEFSGSVRSYLQSLQTTSLTRNTMETDLTPRSATVRQMDQEFGEFFRTFYRTQYEELAAKVDRKGTKFRFFARVLQTAILVLSALTPVLIALSGVEESNKDVALALRVAAIVTSSLIAIVAGIGRIFRPEDIWMNLRALRNALWREHSLYKARLQHYGGAQNTDMMFVERVTDILERYNAKQNKLIQESSSFVLAAVKPHLEHPGP